MKRFRVTIEFEALFTVNELWPGGDAPDNPSKADVEALVAEGGGTDIIDSWGFDGRDTDIRVEEVDDEHQRKLIDSLKAMAQRP